MRGVTNEKNNIIKSEKIGNSNLISISLNYKSIQLLSYLEEEKEIPNLEKIASIKEISDYLILVTGSYAKGSACYFCTRFGVATKRQ